MSGFTDHFEELVTRYLWRAEDPALPATVYVALFTVAPDEAGGGTEVAGLGYARQGVVRSPTVSSRWSAPAADTGLTSNLDEIAFGPADEDWGQVVAVGIFDAVAAGNMLAFGELTTYQDVLEGGTFRFPVGALELEVN